MPPPPPNQQLYISTQALQSYATKLNLEAVILFKEHFREGQPEPPTFTYCYLPLVCLASFVVEI